MNYIYKNRNKLLAILSIILVLPFIFDFGLLYDDPFSMGMINHSYHDIINLTTMDVHPPLYYFVLKTFLSLTTFWTSNIFIKIVFARLLSVLFSLITLLYIIKIMKKLNISFNKYLITLLFIVLPVVFGLDQQAAHIRMYSMCTTMTIIVIYYLISFIRTNNSMNLIIISILSALSLYTNYYFGLISGMYILSAVIYTTYKNKLQSSIKLIFSGIVSLALFIPWIPNLLTQISASNSNSVQSFTTTSKITIVEYIILMTFILFSFILKSGISKKILYLAYSSYLISIIIFILNIIMYPVSVSLRYTSTPLILLLILSITITKQANRKNITANNVVKILMLLFISLSFAKSLRNEIKQYNIPSISFINKFNKIKKSKDTEINSNKYSLNDFTWKNQAGNAIYLLSINKKISDKNYTNVYYSVGNGNVKLFHAIFPNIEHYYSKKE